jgi:hypothetical protein
MVICFLEVIDTDSTGSCKSNYHIIATMASLHHCLQVIIRFVISGIVDHHFLEVIVHLFDISGIVNNIININLKSLSIKKISIYGHLFFVSIITFNIFLI